MPGRSLARALQYGFAPRRAFPGFFVTKLFLSLIRRAYVRPLALLRRQFYIHVGKGVGESFEF